MATDWLLERTVDTAMNGVSFCLHLFSNLDFADDVTLLDKLLELLVPAREMIASEATCLALQQGGRAIDSHSSRAVAEELVYLGSLIHSTTQTSPDILCHSAIIRAAMQNLDNQIWKPRISVSAMLTLCNTCILPMFLYGYECWAIT